MQQLAVHTVGGVVTPAQPLMIVVPKDDPPEIEAFIENKDVGFVHPGQPAEIKIETFPYTKHGIAATLVVHMPKRVLGRRSSMRALMTPLVRRSTIFALLLTVTFLTGQRTRSSAAADSVGFGIVPHPDNTSHLDPGIAAPNHDAFPFFPSRASTAGRKVAPDMFDAPGVCGGCHIDIYAQWKGSMHSNSWTDPIYRAALNAISKATGGKADQFCMGCHTPVGVVTGEATPSGDGMSAIADRGVQCEVCHNISRSTGIGNGAYVLTPRLHGRPLKFGPFDDSVSPYHDTAYSKLHTQSEFCGQCHDVTHPFNRMPIERTYSEWRDSLYAARGVQCQDCHMKPVRGRATPFSKERERIYTHHFVGGNTLVTKMLGSETHSKLAEELLRSAARVEILPAGALVAGQVNKVRVRVTNVGAGHKLPTGFPEGREMWLDFKVVDRRGRVLYRLGTVKDGQTEQGTQSFKVVLGDKDGNVVPLNVLDADRILYDTRLEPKGSRDVEYVFTLPEKLSGRVQLVADLNYWSFSQALLDHLLGQDAPKTHIIKMTSAAATVAIRRPPGRRQDTATAPR